MKLASLFSKFLYENKELRLPGIGIFTLDPSVTVPDAADKNTSDFTQNIKYDQKPVSNPDEKFINFIRTETGKIKPLAESDLDSFLSDGKILLNIGKPFLIEGIGFLQKTREGVYEFTPGEVVLPRSSTQSAEKQDEGQRGKSFYAEPSPQGTNMRKIFILVGAVAFLVIIIWGGYSMYNRSKNKAMANIEDTVSKAENTERAVLLDSVQNKIDSAVSSAQAGLASQNAGTYRFVIERTPNKLRAIRRFNQIRESSSEIKMESRDSTLFSIYFDLPSTPADTSRIRDSLKNWYGRRIVIVEKP